VIVAYLAYTIYEADWSLQRASNFYRDLAVPLDADERKIQAQFRKLYVTSIQEKVSVEANWTFSELSAITPTKSLNRNFVPRQKHSTYTSSKHETRWSIR
jgi:hypothetical protein